MMDMTLMMLLMEAITIAVVFKVSLEEITKHKILVKLEMNQFRQMDKKMKIK